MWLALLQQLPSRVLSGPVPLGLFREVILYAHFPHSRVGGPLQSVRETLLILPPSIFKVNMP